MKPRAGNPGQCKDHGRVARDLHDLLPAAFFFRESTELGDHSRQQLQHDRCADVGHDAEREDRAIFQRTAAEQIEERRHSAAGFLAERVAEPACRTAGLTPGVLIAAPRRTITTTASVKRIRRRSSGILTVLRNAETMTKTFWSAPS